MATYYQLDFEKPVAEVEQRIEAVERELSRHVPASPGTETGDPETGRLRDEAETLRQRREALLREIYGKLTPWQTVRVARHPMRAQTRDYIAMICRDFDELHG
ncbi:MAG: acetyl-CoA carboxylase carboxyl transferase subunit alpha, partial [Phycisphaerales bacterium]